MASIGKRADGRYRARWREHPGGPQKTRQFGRKVDADRFVDTIRGDLARGVYIDPADAKILFRTYAEEWRAGQLQRARCSAHTHASGRRRAAQRADARGHARAHDDEGRPIRSATRNSATP